MMVRLLIVLGILVAALMLIFVKPPGVSVPGVRLVYDIKQPAGGAWPEGRLSAAMIAGLQKRVDPSDILDIKWAPVGAAQIEAVVPLRAHTAQQNAADVVDFKRMLQGSGVLEFHILCSKFDSGRSGMLDRLKPGGPGPDRQAGDAMGWFPVERPDVKGMNGYATGAWKNETYVLAWLTPEKSMDHRSGTSAWAVTRAEPQTGANGEAVVGFGLDSNGASNFGLLTKSNINQPLGVFISGRLLEAATIRSMITSSGQIDGGREGFSKPDIDRLVNTLQAGSLPAELSDAPVMEQNVRTTITSPLRPLCVGTGVLLVLLDVALAVFLLIFRRRPTTRPPPLPTMIPLNGG